MICTEYLRLMRQLAFLTFFWKIGNFWKFDTALTMHLVLTKLR